MYILEIEVGNTLQLLLQHAIYYDFTTTSQFDKLKEFTNLRATKLPSLVGTDHSLGIVRV